MIKPKQSVQTLKNYQPNTDAYLIKLDANEEKPYMFDLGKKTYEFPIHLYPDNESSELSYKIADIWSLSAEEVIVGNGSSEILELLVKTFVDTNEVILGFEPSFSMYRIYAQIHNANYIAIESEPNFSLDMTKMILAANTYKPKLIFICSPNNPTGYLIPKDEILKLLKQTDAIVVVDEAYMEFSLEDTSVIEAIREFDNLIVTRTFSKAYGLAALRLGYGLANESLIQTLKKVKAPYNVNAFSQTIGLEALAKQNQMITYTNAAKQRRLDLIESMNQLEIKTYPSQANFVFFQGKEDLYQKLIEQGIMIRAFKGDLQNYYRVTVGNEQENKTFMKTMEAILNE